ncbi:MAG: hypothetical protein WAQ99_02250 [Pyrinomonadaceae bacterium]
MGQQLARQQTELEKLRAVKRAAKEQFSGIVGVTGFGIGEHTIRIYVNDPNVTHKLPAEFRGIAIDVVLAQDFVAR